MGSAHSTNYYSENQQCQLLHDSPSQLTSNMGQNQLTNSNFMSQTDPDILRAKFNIHPDMTVNIYYVEDAGENIIENGFNYEEPPQTDKQHIQLMKQKFNIPPNMTVNTYYMGNSSDDINNAFNAA